jgi:DNA-binding transcriptional regulator YbjK
MAKDSTASSRRELIADAALLIIAEQGARHLTHRAVDAQLALPAGSTSYYFSTRAALLDAAVALLVQYDEADIRALLAEGRTVGTSSDTTQFASDLLALWSAPAARTRLAARLELLLDSARAGKDHPLRKSRRRFLRRVEQAFVSAGAAQPAVCALRFIACLEGLMLHELVGPKMPSATVEQVFASFDSGPEQQRGAKARAGTPPPRTPSSRS